MHYTCLNPAQCSISMQYEATNCIFQFQTSYKQNMRKRFASEKVEAILPEVKIESSQKCVNGELETEVCYVNQCSIIIVYAMGIAFIF